MPVCDQNFFVFCRLMDNIVADLKIACIEIRREEVQKLVMIPQDVDDLCIARDAKNLVDADEMLLGLLAHF